MDLLESMLELEESLATARKKYLDTDLVDAESFEELQNGDPTSTKKYLEWMCKVWVEDQTGQGSEMIIPIILDFDRFVTRNQIEHKDINSYKTFEELQTIVTATKEKGGSKTQKRKEKEAEVKKDKNVVYQDKNITVIVPQNHEQSKLYGANTKWCTAERTSTHWDSYWAQGIKMYYIMDKKNNTKWAVAVSLNGNKQCYNAADQSVTMEVLMKNIGIQM